MVHRLLTHFTKKDLELVFSDHSEWLKTQRGSKLLTDLTVPGTHDTCARIHGGEITITQTLTIPEQLNAGIRFLDIRCRHQSNSFAIHHGPIFQDLYFTDVRRYCYNFLADHPSEFIIMSVKEEYHAEECQRTFEDTFLSYVDEPDRWMLEPKNPTVDSIRGKIVLLRRFKATKDLGIDASDWLDDKTFEISTSTPVLSIQDEYKVHSIAGISDKWQHVRSLLNEALLPENAHKLFLNFGSGTAPTGAFPHVVAKGAKHHGQEGINPHFLCYFQNALQTPSENMRFGIIVLDFPDPELLTEIIRINDAFP